jgi:hypothetical protein
MLTARHPSNSRIRARGFCGAGALARMVIRHPAPGQYCIAAGKSRLHYRGMAVVLRGGLWARLPNATNPAVGCRFMVPRGATLCCQE